LKPIQADWLSSHHRKPIMAKAGLICGVLAVLFYGCAQDATQQSQPAQVVAENRVAPVTQRNHPVRYAVRDGHISYLYKGLQRGTEEVYFTDYGMVEIKFTQTVRDNPFTSSEEQINLITLMRDSMIYVVDNLTKNARRLDNALLYESALESPSLDLNEVAEMIYRNKGGNIVGTDTIAGAPAQHWRIKEANTNEWRWLGIMLKTQVDLPRSFVQVEAIRIDTVSPLPQGIFNLPTDVKVQDGISMKQWMEDLSKPVERKKFFDLRDPNKAYDKQGNVIPIESLRVE
jgi:hypothetical protein